MTSHRAERTALVSSPSHCPVAAYFWYIEDGAHWMHTKKKYKRQPTHSTTHAQQTHTVTPSSGMIISSAREKRPQKAQGWLPNLATRAHGEANPPISRERQAINRVTPQKTRTAKAEKKKIGTSRGQVRTWVVAKKCLIEKPRFSPRRAPPCLTPPLPGVWMSASRSTLPGVVSMDRRLASTSTIQARFLASCATCFKLPWTSPPLLPPFVKVIPLSYRTAYVSSSICNAWYTHPPPPRPEKETSARCSSLHCSRVYWWMGWIARLVFLVTLCRLTMLFAPLSLPPSLQSRHLSLMHWTACGHALMHR